MGEPNSLSIGTNRGSRKWENCSVLSIVDANAQTTTGQGSKNEHAQNTKADSHRSPPLKTYRCLSERFRIGLSRKKRPIRRMSTTAGCSEYTGALHHLRVCN
jgi:hypothetical protein